MLSKLRAKLRGLFGKSPRSIDNPHINDRGIFVYRCPDGTVRGIDVFVADRNLRQHGANGAWSEHIRIMEIARKAAESGNPSFQEKAQVQMREAFDHLSDLSRKVFFLPAFDQPCGFSDAEAFLLFVAFVRELGNVRNEFLPLPKLPA